jgi:hypothetical protein
MLTSGFYDHPDLLGRLCERKRIIPALPIRRTVFITVPDISHAKAICSYLGSPKSKCHARTVRIVLAG